MSYNNTSAHLRVWSGATPSTARANGQQHKTRISVFICGRKRKSSTQEPLSRPRVWEPLEVGGMRGKLCLRNEAQSSKSVCPYECCTLSEHNYATLWNKVDRVLLEPSLMCKGQNGKSFLDRFCNPFLHQRKNVIKKDLPYFGRNENIRQTSLFLAHKTQISI